MFILHFVGCGQLQQKRRLKASQKGLKGAGKEKGRGDVNRRGLKINGPSDAPWDEVITSFSYQMLALQKYFPLVLYG